LKKVLSLLLLVMTAALVTGGYFVWERYQQNPEQLVPYPYSFQDAAPSLKLDAPILIAGDRMGLYFSKFSSVLAETISQNLAKPIKIQSIAKSGHALHRTLHELKSLTQWPQILIFQGASEEFFETKFIPSEIPKITENFKRYTDDRIETFLILYPRLSRLVYDPIKRVSLPAVPEVEKEITEEMFLRRLETELMLFEQQLIELVSISKDRNTLLILTTTPINLDERPRKVCEFTRTTDIDAEILGLRDLLKANNPKMAYTKSSRLITQYSGNAELLYLHGQVAKRLRNLDVAKNALLEASAYDCEPWRATELQNSIIKKVAKEHQVLLFDFARLVEKDFAVNTTFFDEIHPQNLYYDIGMKQLGLVIKSILKL
jgi:hypothetical protein